MIYFWLLSIFIGGLLFWNDEPVRPFVEQIDADNCQRSANDLLNRVTDWQQHDRQIPANTQQIHFTTLGDTHFVWTLDKPGLVGCLMMKSAHSRLIVRLHQGVVTDPEGAVVNLMLPPGIPDNSLIYYYQE